MKQSENSKDKKIAFVYDKLHPIHKRLMESIKADFMHYSEKISSRYDIYIFEASYARAILMKMMGKIKGGKKIVSLISDPRLYYLDQGKSFDFKKKKIRKYPFQKSIIMKFLIKRLDGAFCLGELNFKLFKKFSPHSRAIRFRGFISNKIFKKLEKVSPNLKSKKILFLGHGPDYFCKGLDVLIDAFKIVKKRIQGAQLYISGEWDVKKDWEFEGINFLGKRENILEFIKMASLGVHVGRGEAFGANVPEMMLAGIPVITSNLTGAKEAVEKFDKSFVVDVNKKKVAEKIVNYLESPFNEKKRLSREAKNTARSYSEEKIVREFRKNAKEFLNSL